MKIGAHISASGGLLNALRRGIDIRVEAIQIFNGSPRVWSKRPHPQEDVQSFKKETRQRQWPIFIHGIYLINLASNDHALYNKSINNLVADLRFADAVNARGVIFHVGSYGKADFAAALPRVAHAITRILARTSACQAKLVLENSTRGGGKIGWNHKQFQSIYKAVNAKYRDRIGFCLDTCHAFVSGYNLKTPDGVARWLRDFERRLGIARLLAFHGNDSKAKFNSGLDRHANIGQGELGRETFRHLLNQKICQAPLFIEVPGTKGHGPDKKNVDILKSLRT